MWLWLVLFGAAFVVRESEEIRFDIIYGAVGPGAAARHGRSSPPSRLVGPLQPVAAGGDRLRHLHEGAEDGLSEDPLRLALLDLRRLRRRHDRPLPLARLAGDLGQGAGGVRSDQGGLGRMNLASPFSISLVAITALALLGLPIGHRDDRRLDPLSLSRRPRHGDGRRAAPQRHVHQLRHAGRAAVHPGGRTDEHRQPDRAAAALLRRRRRPLPRRPRPGQRPAEHHLRRHVRLGHRRRRRHRQDDAEHDDQGRQVHAELRGGADRRHRRSSGRSFRRRSRWCSTPSSPMPRSATCSSAASFPAC